MTRPECPNCLRPVIAHEEDGRHIEAPRTFCWEGIPCRAPDGYNLSTAEIRDLRAGFAATWAEMERLRANLDMMHMDAVARHHGEKERTARLRHECEYWEARCKGEIARLTRERDAAIARADKAEADFAAALETFEKASVIAREAWQRERARVDKAEAELAVALESLADVAIYLKSERVTLPQSLAKLLGKDPDHG